MNYELAKQLKDAGFPQQDGLKFIDAQTIWDATMQSDYETSHTPLRSTWVKCPTLEELIEACGEDFRLLESHWSPAAPWSAHAIGASAVIGATPTEAVAKLWLALNKKI